jgi:hypothetical protein
MVPENMEPKRERHIFIEDCIEELAEQITKLQTQMRSLAKENIKDDTQ